MSPEPHRSRLSVVIVTYNEADRIRKCIESVLSVARTQTECDVILVDSNSTDRTVDIAREHPITIVRIPEAGPITPAAGRYVGTNVAEGELVLFVDGDMEIQLEWVEAAIAILGSRPEVAAVDGHLNEPSYAEGVTEVDSVRGVALYRRDALESVGGFDPYLQSVEDIHLGYELTAAGHTLLRLPGMAAIHPDRGAVSEPLRRWRRGSTIGPGQAVRRSLSSPQLLGKHLYRIRHRTALFAWFCLGAGSAVLPALFLLWVGLSAIFVGILIHRLDVRGATDFLFSKLLGMVGFLLGVSRPVQSPESFPLADITIVQRGAHLSGLPSD